MQLMQTNPSSAAAQQQILTWFALAEFVVLHFVPHSAELVGIVIV